MNIIQSYKDLCEEIEAWELRVRTYQEQIKTVRRLGKLDGPSDISGIDYSRDPVQSTSQIGFAEAIISLQKLQSHLELHTEALEKLYEKKDKLEEHIAGLEGLDQKVVYMRDIQGKSLLEIANELGYSYDYIRKISARNPKIAQL